MPAIHLAQLKLRCAHLAEQFGQTDLLISELRNLLESYSNRAHRPGQAGTPPPLLPSFNVPKPVLRQVLIELSPLAAADAENGLALCDAMWLQPWFEFRYLASNLLSHIPLDNPDQVLERVVGWTGSYPEARLLDAIMDLGTKRLRSEMPDEWIRQIENWLTDPDPRLQKTGVNALIPLIASGDYDNLPVFYRLLAPVARNIPDHLREDTREVLVALARRSPIETAYYLGQYLEATGSPDSAWLARQCMPYFSKESQDLLRAKIRSSSELKSPEENPRSHIPHL
jgi:hypothetical protein